MKRKPETKDPSTLDSLLESKEQTDKALAELADTLREELRKLEAVVGSAPATPETADSRRQFAADASGAGAPLLPSAVCRLPSVYDKRFWIWFCWAAILVLQVLFFAYYLGLFTSDKPVVPVPSPSPSSGLLMTQQEAKLVRSAIELVRDDVVEGRLTSTALTLQALSSLLPSRVRDVVLKELGTPDMAFMRDALDILEGKLPTIEGETND